MGKPLPTWTHTPLYLALRGAMTVPMIAGCPASLSAASAFGRRFARAPFNAKRLDRAMANIRQALPDCDDAHARELATQAYEHLFKLAAEMCFAPRLLNEDGWTRHLEIINIKPTVDTLVRERPVLMLTGHIGNWEILGLTTTLLGFPMHALYRPLDVTPLDRWVRQTRSKRGMTLIDKFGAAVEVPRLLEQAMPIGIVADQNAGDRGMHVPFLGRLASTYKLIGILAIRANATIIVGGARRLAAGDEQSLETIPGIARLDYEQARGLCYRAEMYDIIQPEDWADQPDPLFYITARYRHAIEKMVLSFPEQYLWMHRIWKSRPRHEVKAQPFPPALKEKLLALPWLSSDDVERLIDRSDRDARWLSEHDTDRLP